MSSPPARPGPIRTALLHRSNVRIDALYNLLPHARPRRARRCRYHCLLLIAYMSLLTTSEKPGRCFSWTSWEKNSVAIYHVGNAAVDPATVLGARPDVVLFILTLGLPDPLFALLALLTGDIATVCNGSAGVRSSVEEKSKRKPTAWNSSQNTNGRERLEMAGWIVIAFYWPSGRISAVPVAAVSRHSHDRPRATTRCSMDGRLSLAIGEFTWDKSKEFILVAVPMFILLGRDHAARRHRTSACTMRAVVQWLSWLPGGLMHANIGSCAIFAASSGSSVATAATVGTVVVSGDRPSGAIMSRLFLRVPCGRWYAWHSDPTFDQSDHLWSDHGYIRARALSWPASFPAIILAVVVHGW